MRSIVPASGRMSSNGMRDGIRSGEVVPRRACCRSARGCGVAVASARVRRRTRPLGPSSPARGTMTGAAGPAGGAPGGKQTGAPAATDVTAGRRDRRRGLRGQQDGRGRRSGIAAPVRTPGMSSRRAEPAAPAQPVCMKLITSPSWTTYSLPSVRSSAFSRAAWNDLSSMRSSMRDHLGAHEAVLDVAVDAAGGLLGVPAPGQLPGARLAAAEVAGEERDVAERLVGGADEHVDGAGLAGAELLAEDRRLLVVQVGQLRLEARGYGDHLVAPAARPLHERRLLAQHLGHVGVVVGVEDEQDRDGR